MDNNHDIHDLEYLNAELSTARPLQTQYYKVTILEGVVTIDKRVTDYEKALEIMNEYSQDELEEMAKEDTEAFTKWYEEIETVSHVITEIENGERWLKALSRTGFEEWQYDDYSCRSYLRKNNISFICDGSSGWKIQYKFKDCEPVKIDIYEHPEGFDAFCRLLKRKK